MTETPEEINYTGLTHTTENHHFARVKYRKNRQAAAERAFLALRNTKPGQQPQTAKEQDGIKEKIS